MRYRDKHTGQIKTLARETNEYMVLLNSEGQEENWQKSTFINTWEKMA